MPFGGGGIGVQEILLLALLAILLFGTKKLPQLGRSAGKGMREFKDSVTGFKKPIGEVTEAIALDDVKDVAALRSPKTALSRILTDRPDEVEEPAEGSPETDT